MTSPATGLSSNTSPATPTAAGSAAPAGVVGQQKVAGEGLKSEASPSSSSISTTSPKSLNSQDEAITEASSSSPITDTLRDSGKDKSGGGDGNDKQQVIIDGAQSEGDGAGKTARDTSVFPDQDNKKEGAKAEQSDQPSSDGRAGHSDNKRKRDGHGDREGDGRGGAGRDYGGGKKARKSLCNTDFPKRREDMTPEQLRQRIRRQVEYYLSDESLSYDAFFQEKMKEAAQQGKGVGP